MLKKHVNGKTLSIIFFCAIFAFIYIFFTQIHPLVVFDADDWTYIAYSRNAFPTIKEWNPTRIFPEIIMPLIGFIAAFIVTPLTNNYLGAMSWTFVFFLALIITFYAISLALSLRRMFHLSNGQMYLWTTLFIIAHFWIFRINNTNNMYLFYAKDLTCYYYYTIPTLINIILVVLFEVRPFIWREISPFQKGLLLLTLYLAIFSNMFCSIVLVAYCGVVLLERVFLTYLLNRSRENFFSNLIKNGIYLGIIIVWLISLCFELMGGRAESVGLSGKFEGIRLAFALLLTTIQNTNRIFLLFALTSVILAACIAVHKCRRKKETEETLAFLRREFRLLLSAIVVALYQILLCGVTSLAYHIVNGDVLISIYCFVFIFIFSASCYTVKNLPKLEVFLPIIVCIALLNCNTFYKTFLEPCHYRGEARIASQIGQDIYNEILAADAANQKTLILRVPDYVTQNNTDNWPLATTYYGERISRTLYKHGQIKSLMDITVVPDATLNEFYGIDDLSY